MKFKITKRLLPALLFGGLSLPPQVEAEAGLNPTSFEAYSVEELKQQLAQQQPNGNLYLLKALPDDFADITDIQEKKQLFIRLMLPIIVAENQRLAEQRALAQLMIPKQGERKLNKQPADIWLKKILNRYRIKHRGTISPELGQALLRRLDEVPARLVLAQAAIESGWGTSRFALEGNSLFGQWTWDQDSGITPKEREAGATHTVKSFDSLQSSVRAYLLNLNINSAYDYLRELREQLRRQGRDLEAHMIAAGLKNYSQRGDHYVDEVRSIIESSDLALVEQLTLQLARQ